MTKTYDAIVIGTGRAGPFLAQRLAGAGMNVGVRAVAPRMPCIEGVPYLKMSSPLLGRAGLTEAEVRKSNRRALIGWRPMTKVGRAVEKGETQGFMKIIVDAQTHEILGAAK